jgi:hypothetical protein
VTEHHATPRSPTGTATGPCTELDLLSMVAFAMFNRGQQMVTDTGLLDDPSDGDRALDWPG